MLSIRINSLSRGHPLTTPFVRLDVDQRRRVDSARLEPLLQTHPVGVFRVIHHRFPQGVRCAVRELVLTNFHASAPLCIPWVWSMYPLGHVSGRADAILGIFAKQATHQLVFGPTAIKALSVRANVFVSALGNERISIDQQGRWQDAVTRLIGVMHSLWLPFKPRSAPNVAMMSAAVAVCPSNNLLGKS